MRLIPSVMIKSVLRFKAKGPGGTLSWIRDGEEEKIRAYFGSKKGWECTPGWDHFTLAYPDKTPNYLDHGYDEWKAIKSRIARAEYFEQIRQKMAAVPGVISAGISTDDHLPYGGREMKVETLGQGSAEEQHMRIQTMGPSSSRRFASHSSAVGSGVKARIFAETALQSSIRPSPIAMLRVPIRLAYASGFPT